LRTRLGARAALVGGLWHVIAALAVLFLPLIEVCTGPDCTRYPYWRIGDIAGFAILALTAILGLMAIAASRVRMNTRNWVRLTLGLLSLTSVVVVYVTGWSIGLALAPGTLLLLMAALLT